MRRNRKAGGRPEFERFPEVLRPHNLQHQVCSAGHSDPLCQKAIERLRRLCERVRPVDNRARRYFGPESVAVEMAHEALRQGVWCWVLKLFRVPVSIRTPAQLKSR